MKAWIEASRPELVHAARQWLSGACVSLEQSENRADSIGEANRLFHVHRALDRARPHLPERFVDLLLRTMAERCMEDGNGNVARTPRLGAMELVDDDVVNESIGISKVATRILYEADWEIRAVERLLAPQLGVEFALRSNPFHPEAFARTVWKLAEELHLQAEERAACLKVTLEATAALAKTAYGSLGKWLGRQGATGSLTIKRQDGAGQNAIPVDVLAGGADEPAGLTLEPLEWSPPGAIGDEAASPLVARDKVFKELNRSIEAILADVRLTPELRRVLSGLQMAVLRVAFAFPSALYSPEHEMWRLGSRLVSHALTHCLRDRLAHDDFVLFADQMIHGLMQDPADSTVGLDKRMARITSYLAERPAQLAQNEISAAQHFARLEERRRKLLGQAIARHRERLAAATSQVDIPFRLRQFLMVDWAEVLAQTEVSDGAKSPDYLAFWGAVDGIVAAVQRGTLDTSEADRQRKTELLKVLERGVSCIAVPSVEKYELAALLDRTGMIAREEWADSDVGALHEPQASPSAGRRRDFWGATDAASPWAPTASTTGHSTAMPAADAEQCVNALRVGSSVELFLVGAWIEVRVARMADEGRIFQFEDEADGGTHQLTRRALLRLFREGLAAPLR